MFGSFSFTAPPPLISGLENLNPTTQFQFKNQIALKQLCFLNYTKKKFWKSLSSVPVILTGST